MDAEVAASARGTLLITGASSEPAYISRAHEGSAAKPVVATPAHKVCAGVRYRVLFGIGGTTKNFAAARDSSLAFKKGRISAK